MEGREFVIDSVSDPVSEKRDSKPPVRGDRRSSVGGTLDRLPPRDEQMEMGVLGCCLIDPMIRVPECAESITEKAAFYDLRHQTIWESILELSSKGYSADLISVQSHLKDRQLLEQVGGIVYLSQLQDAVPSAANLSYYLEKVREKYLLRKLIATCSGVVGKVYDYEGEVEELLSEAEREVLAVRPRSKTGASASNLVLEASNEIEAAFGSGGKITGLSTGLADLDRLTDGVHGGEAVILGGFPSTGKTTLAMNIAEHNFLNGIPVGIASAEMLPRKLIRRSICSVSRVNFRDVQRGMIDQSDFAKMTSAAARISKAPVFVENASGMSIEQVVAMARRMVQQRGIKLFVIDYLQLLSHKADSREQEVSGISKGAKAIATQLGIGVIALSQLNDDGKLRESRAIGQDADSIWLLSNNGEWQPKIQPITCVVEKCRDGETGKVPLAFLKTITRFENAARESE